MFLEITDRIRGHHLKSLAVHDQLYIVLCAVRAIQEFLLWEPKYPLILQTWWQKLVVGAIEPGQYLLCLNSLYIF